MEKPIVPRIAIGSKTLCIINQLFCLPHKTPDVWIGVAVGKKIFLKNYFSQIATSKARTLSNPSMIDDRTLVSRILGGDMHMAAEACH
jgi:hypothetical protein